MWGRSRPAPVAAARLESLSDMVFGLALSIGAILLVGTPPTSLQPFENDIIEFAFSFFVIISVWIRHTRTMAVVPIETSAAVRLTLILLFFVAIEPFLFNALFQSLAASPGQPALPVNISSTAYAIDLVGLAGVTTAILWVAHLEARERGDLALDRTLRHMVNYQTLGTAIFAISALPGMLAFALPILDLQPRYFLWFAGTAVGSYFSSRVHAQPNRRDGSAAGGEPAPSPPGTDRSHP